MHNKHASHQGVAESSVPTKAVGHTPRLPVIFRTAWLAFRLMFPQTVPCFALTFECRDPANVLIGDWEPQSQFEVS